MAIRYTLYGWELSYFSAKLRAYLRFKRLNFSEKTANVYDMTRRIPKNVGASVLPVLKTASGDWLQDTTEIIQRLEQQHPEPGTEPPGARQQIAARLLEAWADEYWIPAAMHYRWNFDENVAFFKREAGRALLPIAPNFLRNKAVQRPMKFLRSALPNVGVSDDSQDLIERWTNVALDELETHFSQAPYLLGPRPCVGDFALIGPIYAHLGRDPYSKRQLIDGRPDLTAWINRVYSGEAVDADWPGDDELPDSLTPILQRLLGEFLPMIFAIAEQTEQHSLQNHLAAGDKLPRTLQQIAVPMAGDNIKRAAMPYTLWMAQQSKAHYAALSSTQQAAVDSWLAGFDAPPLRDWRLGPELARRALATRLAPSSPSV